MFVDEKQQGEAQTAEQANRKLKLSEAIRIGSLLRPQATGAAFAGSSSCAIGAAYEARTGKTCDAHDGAEQMRVVPEAYMNAHSYSPLGWGIVDRNDSGHSREQIADWLEAQGL